MPSWDKYLSEEEQSAPYKEKNKPAIHKRSDNQETRLERQRAEKAIARAEHLLKKQRDSAHLIE